MSKIFPWALAFSVLLFSPWVSSVMAEVKLKAGVLRLTSSAPMFIAQERGFFKDEGLDVKMIFFKSAQPVAVALASGDIDLGATGLTAGLYNAISGGLKATIVSDKGRVWPGYQLVGLMVSNRAWEEGLRRLEDLQGRRVGVTQIGSTFHYMLGNMLTKVGMDLKDVKITPLGGVKNMMDTVSADRIDAAFMVQPFCSVMETKKMGRRMLWVSDLMSYQIAAIFFGNKPIEEKSTGLSFMRAYIRACRFYHNNCLLKSGGQLIRGPHFDDIIGYISKYTERKPELITMGLNYNDRDGRLYKDDIQRQVDWYFKNGLITQKLDADAIVDMSIWEDALRSLR